MILQYHQVEYARLAPNTPFAMHQVLFCPYWISNLTSLPITYSHPSKDGSTTGDVEVAAGQEVLVVEETYENQRWYPLNGWSKKLLKTERHSWSDRKGQCKASKTKETFALPSASGWQWQSEWEIDLGIGDEEVRFLSNTL